ncbi:SusC/RagA family TonB-linked outer membrane protein [Sediminibacterium sp.]|uniref:SusC/RagA family TonB-linked outer membrane protein n=1 Tax=Sediminibacterium sp. TaxID=1917865 RepID=UPI00272F1313|nr:SusC/RagA family TonB-linked outer membrane protein [Sediminibacterium sp.]MDP2421439.1 SusC/RagA family TonB-linked outer membrane protein [Sediminibacterium sp.]
MGVAPAINAVCKKAQKPDIGKTPGGFVRPRFFLYSFTNTIFMRHIIRALVLLCMCLTSYLSPAQTSTNTYEGRVLDANTRETISGASIQLKNSQLNTISDDSGLFRFKAFQAGDSIIIHLVGYRPIRAIFRPTTTTILLIPNSGESSVTVQTGYQSLPKERATGSFALIDKQLFNRRISTNVLDRLDGVTPGVLFGKNMGDDAITVRGRSTLDAGSAKPLIILDNFPFEGDVNQINPNDVESVTVLKDAAAASIWGSRSANGVVVITTKKGRFNQPLQIGITQNISVGAKPDLYYNRNYLSASDYIDAERYLFNRGYYNASLANTTTRVAVTPVVELLNQFRSGAISQTALNSELDKLRPIDVRDEYSRHLYQREVRQQYAIQLSGGGDKHHYIFSFGYDDNLERNQFNKRSRITLQAQQVFRLHPKLELTTSLYYVTGKQNNPNSYAYRGNTSYYATGSTLYPYAQLADPSGNALITVRDYRRSYIDSVAALGFLPWDFRMLDDIVQTQSESITRSIIGRAGLLYRIINGLIAELQYQQEYQSITGTDIRMADSYTARNIVNRFSVRATNGSFTYPVPQGGILEQSQSVLNSQNLRGQLGYRRDFSDNHSLNALAGFEIRQRKSDSYSRVVYGYDDEYGIGTTNLNYQSSLPVHPFGNAHIPAAPNNIVETINRFVSYYGNAAYTYRKRYTLSASARSDGANLFGLRTNERMTPLWSIGGAWDLTKEKFYRVSWLPQLKLRATYGFNGNAISASSLLTMRYATSVFTGLPYAALNTAPNPELRWEKVQTINIGVDFSALGSRVSGTVEWYRKRGIDLIQSATLPQSTGFLNFSGNGASTLTKGWEFVLNYSVIRKKDIGWDAHLLFNTLRDKVIDFEQVYLPTDLVRTTGNLVAKPGKPLFGIWSYHWAGIDPVNGDPMGYLKGVPSKDYAGILAAATPDSLFFHGSARPTVWGGLRQDFRYRRLSISVNLLYKGGYYFRTSSVSLNYQDLVTSRQHSDYTLRWQQKGDELRSNVPSIVYPGNVPRNDFYTYSSILVERGDHLRLQDIRISYRLGPWGNKRPAFLELYGYVNNLGILWRANKIGIDPDTNDLSAGSENIPAIRTFTLGVNLQLH